MITTEASNNKHNDQGALSAQPLQTPQVTEVSNSIVGRTGVERTVCADRLDKAGKENTYVQSC
ncbi:hypothetical protein PVAP13_5KG246500 [Panicum virgatum]|uniref:Uncharacterized protein n=1 Tax=Panicum virgatum TaxID=38727 RepID=A0A8T0SK10_PANVG|nr:hypothetical protein PVAP13_5KG246500 [Panicum virgatum]